MVLGPVGTKFALIAGTSAVAEIFISYSRKDSEFAEDLLTWLREQGFTDIFLAHDQESGIVAGDEWRKALHWEMQEAEVLILVISDNWFASPWCVGEHRAAQILGKRIIPVVIGVSDPAHRKEISSDPFQRVDVGPDRAAAFERLRDGLMGAGLSQSGFVFDAQRAPVPGLFAFEEADAAVFFGREPDVVRAMDRIRVMQQFNRPKLLVIIGNSGIGKSSLMRAGLIPRLRRHEAGRLRLLGPLALGAQPFRELRRAIRKALPRGGADLAGLAVEDAADSDERLIERLNATFSGPEAQAGRPVVIVDQLEQLLLAEPPQRARFLQFLSKVFNPNNAWLGIATIRADCFPLIQAETAFADIEYELLTLDRINEHRMKDVIEKPAVRVGCRIEPDLVDTLVRDAVSTTALPFLAFVLRELYDTIPQNQVWQLPDYEVLGERAAGINPIAGCVRRRANEAVFGETPESEFDADLRRAFVPMMTDIGDNDQPILRTARISDLPPRAVPALQRLVAARICFSAVDADDVACIGLAHDSLYTVWPPLQRAFEAEKRRLAEWRQAERSAQAWQDQSRSSRWIDHRGVRLMRLARLARTVDYRSRVSQRLRDYITACQRHAIVVILRRAAAAAVVLGIAAAFGYEYEARARLLSAADQAIERDSLRAGALAFAALPPPGSLLRIEGSRSLALLTKSKLAFARGVFASAAGMESVAFSPDGRWLATASDSGEVTVWSTDRVVPPHRIIVTADRPLQVVKFDAGGKAIATGGADGILRLIDTASWQVRSSERGHALAINDLAFDPVGANVLTVSADGTAILWDAMTLATRGKLALADPDTGEFNCVAYGRDGSIAIGASDRTVRRWQNASDPSPVKVWTDNSVIHSCDFDHEARRLVIGTDEGHVAILDLAASTADAIVSIPTEAVRGVMFSPDGELVASAWDDGVLRLTGLRSSTPAETRVVSFLSPVGSSAMSDRKAVRAVAFDSAGKQVASASLDGATILWDVKALQTNAEPSASTLFGSLCDSVLASRLTLWRDDGEGFEPTSDCACARGGLLSKSFWARLAPGTAERDSAPLCRFAGP